eukprot:4599299-Amphidinium_carterae.1
MQEGCGACQAILVCGATKIADVLDRSVSGRAFRLGAWHLSHHPLGHCSIAGCSTRSESERPVNAISINEA